MEKRQISGAEEFQVIHDNNLLWRKWKLTTHLQRGSKEELPSEEDSIKRKKSNFAVEKPLPTSDAG